MKLLISATVIALLLTSNGCATSIRYRAFACNDLHAELKLAIVERDSHIREQNDARSRDIWSNLFFFPGSGAINNDHDHEVAESKGKVIAIERELEDRCATSTN
ncbi:MAG: hypothetical protein J4G19_08675 [Pseudomonadales bacterium]|nr:hypothetical protein [Pseudomonadales bacterium]